MPVPPARDPRAWLDAGPCADHEPGAVRPVRDGELRVALCRDAAGAFSALADRCPHAGAPLSEGVLREDRLVCPWHGFVFRPATGACVNVPSCAPVPRHAVEVEGGRVFVARAPLA